jgi:hypothetical protein
VTRIAVKGGTDHRRRLRGWLAGLIVGVVAGFWFAEWPTLGAVIAVLFAIPAAMSRERVAALGGLLLGIPAMWLTVIGLATARCADFDAQPGQDCVMADVGPWAAVAVALLVAGSIASVAAARS